MYGISHGVLRCVERMGFSEPLFSVKQLDDFAPEVHSLRSIREMANLALQHLDGLLESNLFVA